MAKYRLRNIETGAEHVVDCPEAALAERIIGIGPVKIGARFFRTSKLDGRQIIEELVGVVLKSVNTDYGGISKHATWPLRSDAMGINPDYRLDALKADEELGIHGVDYDPNTGEAIFSTPGVYQRFVEAHGFFDRNAGYSGPKKRDPRERDNMGLPQLADPAPCGNAPVMLDEETLARMMGAAR